MTTRKSERVEWGDIFSLQVPVTWVMHEEDGVISLFDDEEGVGVVQISMAKRTFPQKPTMREAMELAGSYASRRKWSVPTTSVRPRSIANATAVEFSVQEDIGDALRYWRVWHVMGRDRIAYITYNCLATDVTAEEDACNSLIDSFRWM